MIGAYASASSQLLTLCILHALVDDEFSKLFGIKGSSAFGQRIKWADEEAPPPPFAWWHFFRPCGNNTYSTILTNWRSWVLLRPNDSGILFLIRGFYYSEEASIRSNSGRTLS